MPFGTEKIILRSGSSRSWSGISRCFATRKDAEAVHGKGKDISPLGLYTSAKALVYVVRNAIDLGLALGPDGRFKQYNNSTGCKLTTYHRSLALALQIPRKQLAGIYISSVEALPSF
jgi:hypothetical protein